MIHHVKRATRHLIFWSLLAIAVGLTLLRLLISGIATYRHELADNISAKLGTPVTIGSLGAKMRGFTPELIAKNLTIASVDEHPNPAIALKEIHLGLDLLDLLMTGDTISSTRISLVGAKLSVRRKDDGSISIIGLKASDEQPTWLFQGRKFEVLQSEVTWQDSMHRLVPLTLDNVNLAIINKDDNHQINLLARLPEYYGETLTAVFKLNGNPFQPADLNGSVYFKGKNLDVANLTASAFAPVVHLNTGQLNLQAWGKLQNSQIIALRTVANAENLRLQPQDHTALQLKSLDTDFSWRLQNSVNDKNRDWRLDVQHLQIATTDSNSITQQWPDTVFSAALKVDADSTPQTLSLFIDALDFREIALLAQFVPSLTQEVKNLLVQIQPQGSLENFALFADLTNKQGAITGELNAVTTNATDKIPGFENFNAKITGTEKQGFVRLVTQDSKITANSFFSEPLVIKNLDASLTWQQNQHEWFVFCPDFKLNLDNFNSSSRLRLTIPKDGDQPFLDLQGTFASSDVTSIKHYFPTKVMKPADVEWLSRAFVHGRVENGQLLYFGKLGNFPVQGSTDIFEALFDAQEAELHYAPDWPHITDISAHALFLQDRMEIYVNHGVSNKLITSNAVVINEAVGKSKVLLIKGDVDGEIAQVLDFLKQTPLNDRVGNLVDAIEPVGNTKVALDLVVPVSKDKSQLKVDGVAPLTQAKLKINALDLWVTKINGSLKFDEYGIYSDTITAAALNYPIKIHAGHEDSTTLVNVAGHAEISDLEQQFSVPAKGIADGEMAYDLNLRLPYEDLPPELQVNSDLVGVSINLPGALAKSKTEHKPLSLHFDLGDQSLLPIGFAYDQQLKATLKFNTRKHVIDSGHILYGDGEAKQSTEAGLKLEINRNQLNLKDWLGFSSGRQNTEESTVQLREISVNSPQAMWGGSSLGHFQLTLKPEDQHWQGSIDSAFAVGKLSIPNDFNHGTAQLTMDLLDLSVIKNLKSTNTSDTQTSPLLPQDLPLLSISSDKTMWQMIDLGMLSMHTIRLADGIAFPHVELNGLAQTLVLSGDWRGGGTTLQGQLDMPNAGQLFSQLNITKDLVETSAHAEFTAHWPDAPHRFALAKVRGGVDLKFTDGRILSIEPGFGRVLGVLAMAQWGKRLQLDFSDLYEQGLAFNSIKGHFDIRDGKALTNNLVVDAIPANITISGETDFISKTNDQHITVLPKGAEAVPIAGTIMGKVTGLIARTLTGKDQEGFLLGSQYWVKGPWDKMQIIPLHENDGLLQKTWTGITDFPWLQKPEQ